jgi:hypothetical protein
VKTSIFAARLYFNVHGIKQVGAVSAVGGKGQKELVGYPP